jgi:Tfp pilus assembly protein PilX
MGKKIQRKQTKQQGMTLAIALILISVMLVVVTASLRWSGTEQTIAGNMRDREIAFQAAEMGLKACELRLTIFDAKGGDMSYFYKIHISDADTYPVTGTKYYWEQASSWDIVGASGSSSAAKANKYSGPIIFTGGVSSGNVTIANVIQEPRCIIENFALQPSNTEEVVTAAPAYRITSRGVGQRGTYSSPSTPVYLQSIIRL